MDEKTERVTERIVVVENVDKLATFVSLAATVLERAPSMPPAAIEIFVKALWGGMWAWFFKNYALDPGAEYMFNRVTRTITRVGPATDEVRAEYDKRFEDMSIEEIIIEVAEKVGFGGLRDLLPLLKKFAQEV